jgi:hypothetical protein
VFALPSYFCEERKKKDQYDLYERLWVLLGYFFVHCFCEAFLMMEDAKVSALCECQHGTIPRHSCRDPGDSTYTLPQVEAETRPEWLRGSIVLADLCAAEPIQCTASNRVALCCFAYVSDRLAANKDEHLLIGGGIELIPIKSLDAHDFDRCPMSFVWQAMLSSFVVSIWQLVFLGWLAKCIFKWRCSYCNCVARLITLAQIVLGSVYLALYARQNQKLGIENDNKHLWAGIGVSFGISALIFGPMAAIGQSCLLQRWCPRCAQTYDIVFDDDDEQHNGDGDGEGGGDAPPQNVGPPDGAVDPLPGQVPGDRGPIAKGGLEDALSGHGCGTDSV